MGSTTHVHVNLLASFLAAFFYSILFFSTSPVLGDIFREKTNFTSLVAPNEPEEFGRSVTIFLLKAHTLNEFTHHFAIGAPGHNSGQGRVEIQTLNHELVFSINSTLIPNLDDFGEFGSSIISPGDIDGDSIPDLVVGAPQDSGSSSDGAIWILFMDSQGLGIKSAHRYPPLPNVPHPFPLNNFGISLAALGDINGDTVLDIAVGARNVDGLRGAVFILLLHPTGGVENYSWIGAGHGGLSGTILHPGDQFGRSVASLGDIDGDSIPEIVVGADNAGDPPASNAGAVFILFMSENGSTVRDVVKHDLDTFGVPSVDAQLGRGVCALGDANSDFVPDMAVGAPGLQGSAIGKIYLVFLKPDGSILRSEKIHALGLQKFGQTLLSRDMDGDGEKDLVTSTESDGIGTVTEFFLYSQTLCPKIEDVNSGFIRRCNEDKNNGTWEYKLNEDRPPVLVVDPDQTVTVGGDLLLKDGDTTLFVVSAEGQTGSLIIGGCFQPAGELVIDLGTNQMLGENQTLELIAYECREENAEFRNVLVEGGDPCETYQVEEKYEEKSFSVLIGATSREVCEEGDGESESIPTWGIVILVIGVVVLASVVVVGAVVGSVLIFKWRKRQVGNEKSVTF